MPDWLLFSSVTVVLSLAFVGLARASARAVSAVFDAPGEGPKAASDLVTRLESDRFVAQNVLVSHGTVVALLLSAAWFARVPIGAIGLAVPSLDSIGLGVGLGLVLATANEAAIRVADRIGLEHDERLRVLLAPDTPVGWARLLLVVLPLVAVAEELLFRGAFILGLATGTLLPVGGLAVVSSILFGLGHGLQGRLGIVVSIGLGAALAAAFVLTGSLGLVIVAHYVVNAVEFVVNEGLRRGISSQPTATDLRGSP